MNAQARYWNPFVQLKRDAAYIGRYHAADEAVDRWLDILSAIASSSSIGAWAIWRDHAPVWAIIIAASQMLTAIRAYLPYKARLRTLATLGSTWRRWRLSLKPIGLRFLGAHLRLRTFTR